MSKKWLNETNIGLGRVRDLEKEYYLGLRGDRNKIVSDLMKRGMSHAEAVQQYKKGLAK